LAGVLNNDTCRSVRSVIEELLDDGYRDLAVQIEELELPDAAGFFSLVAIQRLVKCAGGSLSSSNWPERCVPAMAIKPRQSVRSWKTC
jgi:anti-anti-sigma regulatory factor